MNEWITEVPEGKLVLHRCDNPGCVNPDHLYIGNHQDNMDDKMKRGRHVLIYGTDNHNAKLTDENVRNIRKEYGMKTQGVLAEEYGVSQSTISNVTRRKKWKHVEDI